MHQNGTTTTNGWPVTGLALLKTHNSQVLTLETTFEARVGETSYYFSPRHKVGLAKSTELLPSSSDELA